MDVAVVTSYKSKIEGKEETCRIVIFNEHIFGKLYIILPAPGEIWGSAAPNFSAWKLAENLKRNLSKPILETL